MPRLNVVDPATATGEAKELFDGPLKDMKINYFKGLANSPAALKAYLAMSEALSGGSLDAADREAIALAVGQRNGCGYCVAAHTAMGKQAGLSEEQTVGARRGSTGDPRRDALVTLALALVEKRGWLDDDDLRAAREAGLGDGEVAEVVANVALNTYSNYFNHVNGTDLDLPAAPELETVGG